MQTMWGERSLRSRVGVASHRHAGETKAWFPVSVEKLLVRRSLLVGKYRDSLGPMLEDEVEMGPADYFWQ